jgi:phosphatidylserine/phosphatidylglycerophosphate/cardiolipin synthase-like enzyme
MRVSAGTAIPGSFNFTASAQSRNAENLLVIRDPQLAAQYRANWESRREVSVSYTDPGDFGSSAEE